LDLFSKVFISQASNVRSRDLMASSIKANKYYNMDYYTHNGFISSPISNMITSLFCDGRSGSVVLGIKSESFPSITQLLFLLIS
jgi:hypothetical protein